MLSGFIALPLPARIACVALIAILAARFANWAIYNWAYHRRTLGPWSKPPQGAAARSWADHLPGWGWWRLRRESSTCGGRFWLRPLLLELLFPVASAWYYHFYISGGALGLKPAALGISPEQLHWQFAGHFVLLWLMTVATFIDFDEQSIPDYVTVPGTLIGLAGAALAPAWLPLNGRGIELQASFPDAWPASWNGTWGLMYALAIVLVWGFALLDRRWISRRGIAKGVQYFWARMFRHRTIWIPVLAITILLAGGITLAWMQQIPRWSYLLSSLMGLAFAGGVTWAVRLSASWGLQVEALGFGDVTLMAMIGTYIGWHPSLIVFFLAPLISIAFVLVRWMLTGETATPYGPYLCAATVVLLVYWNSFWIGWAEPVFQLGGIILGIVVACVVLMGVMLWIWRLVKQTLGLGGY